MSQFLDFFSQIVFLCVEIQWPSSFKSDFKKKTNIKKAKTSVETNAHQLQSDESLE